jgi:hypothetical protein
VLSVTSASTVRAVISNAVSISSPDVRRPVTARKAIAPYDQPSATTIAVHTPHRAKVA